MYEEKSIRVLEPADDDGLLDFEESDLPILRRANGWVLSYLGDDGRVEEHLVLGEVDDVELAVAQARAYLDRAPRTAAWPHG